MDGGAEGRGAVPGWDGPTPVLLFDAARPGARRLARAWWNLVSRDRHELRPLQRASPATVVWVDDDGAAVGLRALRASWRHARPRWASAIGRGSSLAVSRVRSVTSLGDPGTAGGRRRG